MKKGKRVAGFRPLIISRMALLGIVWVTDQACAMLGSSNGTESTAESQTRMQYNSLGYVWRWAPDFLAMCGWYRSRRQ